MFNKRYTEINQFSLICAQTQPPCGAAYSTFCERAPREYHYRRAVNACVETDTVDAADVCNRGANRFSSLDHCLKNCVSAEYPAEECFKWPLFTRCARQDALSRWWHFEGKKCVAWTFPSGGCPANGSKVFTTAQECEEHCRHHGAGCRRPDVVACGRRHLKYPYFAHVYAKEGRVRCLRSSETLLQGKRCLAGANRFRSRQACHASCRNRPPSLG
ncbi:carboxypeptidase inhibitor SmCI [Rhipicephalus sanguineus]|uniref:carboxypeptidase inhibitor SmCI n=1 Tax=Rhipicephalus sanguineus TaxID=34632 RepID=UPI00189508CF|nr:carboxypeptidase inhibitor SmCI [Rhipicephalus sanguineus]